MKQKPIRLKNYINGEWVDAVSGQAFERRNPADTREIVSIVPSSDKADIDAAVDAARAAFEKWRLTPAPKRALIVQRAAQTVEKLKEELGKLVTREMGKILKEGLGDVQEVIDMAYYMAGEGRRMQGETVPSELANKDAKSIREPIGVFALITPWNFPTAIPTWKICPALVCGNTVVFKPSQYTSACGQKLVECFAEAGIPRGVLNLVHGKGSVVGDYLVSHLGIDAVSFTGSCEIGKHIESLCGDLHRQVSLEMGGKNPIIIMDDADLELAVEGCLWGSFGTTGQRCTATSRIIVHRKIKRKFMRMFVERAKKLKLGNGLLTKTDVGPVVSDDQIKKIHEYVQIGKMEEAKLVTGGKFYRGKGCEKGYFYLPTIFDNVRPDMRISREEIFGPVVCIIECNDLNDAIKIANSTKFGLSSSIYTTNVNSSAVAERDLQSGIVYINAPTIGAEVHLPFGGIKDTGCSFREGGGMRGAIDIFSRIKVIYRDYSSKLQKAQIDNAERG